MKLVTSHVLLAWLMLSAAPLLLADSPKTTGDGDEYTLIYKLELGDTVRYRVDHRASVRSTIEGTTQSAVTKSDSVKAWKVTDVLDSGAIEFIHLVESVRMANKLPDRAEMIYDSTKDKTPPPGFEDAAKAVGVPLSVIRMSPRGEILHREVKHHQPAADSEAPVALLLPEAPVAVGDTWNEPRTVPVQSQDGATRDIQCRRHYKLTKVESGVATIEVSYQVLTPIDPAIEAQLVQRLMKGKVKFDIDAGRILGQQMDVDKRVLGFAGPTSSMHYVMRMVEQLIDERQEVAQRPE